MSSSDIVDIELELVLEAIYRRYHYDFRRYSRGSLRRRLQQAAERYELRSLSALQERLLHDPSFFGALLQYMTVPTTEFFRDPSYFLALRKQVIPILRTYPSLKVWVAGCSTGEEVYSLAMLFHEENLLSKTIFYATDINPESLEKARRGIYPLESIRRARDNYRLAGGRGSLTDYVTVAYNASSFKPELLRQAVFSDHSLATDQVFAEVHFVSCRNVLIYFDHELQNRALGLFHDSLVRQGFLGLGPKETLQFSSFKSAFETVNAPERIFRKVSV